MDRDELIAGKIVAFVFATISIAIGLLTCYGLAVVLSLDYSELVSSITLAYLLLKLYKYYFKIIKER